MKVLWILVLTLALPAFAATRSSAAITDIVQVLPEPSASAPASKSAYSDPVFGTEMLRWMDAEDQNAERLGPEYSQLQVWNADMSLMFLGGKYLVDTKTGEIRHEVDFYPLYGAGIRWSTTDPRILYATGGSESCPAAIWAYKLNITENSVSNSRIELVHCFSEYAELEKDSSYEELSDNGRFIGLLARTGNDDYEIFAYDLIDKQKRAVFRLPAGTAVDWVAVSPSGRYMLVLWRGTGAERYRGLEAFDMDMAYLGKVHTGAGHSDLIWDEQDTEWAIIDNSNNYMFGDAKYIVKARIPDGVVYKNGEPDEAATLASGKTVRLFQLGWRFGTHISCKNRHTPRWCVLTTEDESPTNNKWEPLHDEILRVYLDSQNAQPHVERLAHHRSSLKDYWQMPFATSSPDGTRVVFSSDFEDTTGIDPYLIVLAAETQLPPREGGGGTGSGEPDEGDGGITDNQATSASMYLFTLLVLGMLTLCRCGWLHRSRT